eukprot:1424845-Pyramimonas_sp.AAC.1
MHAFESARPRWMMRCFNHPKERYLIAWLSLQRDRLRSAAPAPSPGHGPARAEPIWSYSRP